MVHILGFCISMYANVPCEL
ncbi:unnamed protein product [Cuscuta epithymum]|uniref:Uncharacterized protein n=1 Tax=Cuscuta epithymum TaxID=186058 RepID=A0AAV0FZQ8_9ASTE|nr:unnamed protein product [Cuscuta epithymum]